MIVKAQFGETRNIDIEAVVEQSTTYQHDRTPRIYALHKITIALKFMSYINLKLRPSYQTSLNLCLNKLEISGRSARGKVEQLATGEDH